MATLRDHGKRIWTPGPPCNQMFASCGASGGPKHRGISFLLIDAIKTLGLSIRPLVTGEPHLHEVFFRMSACSEQSDRRRDRAVRGDDLLDCERSHRTTASQKRTLRRGQGLARRAAERRSSMTRLADHSLRTTRSFRVPDGYIRRTAWSHYDASVVKYSIRTGTGITTARQHAWASAR